MREIAWTMLGDELANRVHEGWGFDDEGEIRAYGGEVDIVAVTPSYWLCRLGPSKLD